MLLNMYRGVVVLSIKKGSPVPVIGWVWITLKSDRRVHGGVYGTVVNSLCIITVTGDSIHEVLHRQHSKYTQLRLLYII